MKANEMNITPTKSQPATQSSEVLIYRVNVAAAKLSVSRETISRMARDGDLQLVKIREGKRSSGITALSLHAMINRHTGQG